VMNLANDKMVRSRVGSGAHLVAAVWQNTV
jgi:hypothetical protein